MTAHASDTRSKAARGLELLVTVSAVLFWLGVLYWAYTQSIGRTRYGTLFLGAILSLYLLNESVASVEDRDWLDLSVLAACSLIVLSATYYFFTNYRLVYVIRQARASEHELVLAALLTIVMLYLTWRTFGMIFLVLVGGVILYGYYGFLAPGIFYHAGLEWDQILMKLVTDLTGFYGFLTRLTAAWIAPFLLYAGLLSGYGAFNLILRIAIQSAKYIESGVAQTAVISSAVIGSINGSYTANAGMTGSFTIPTMKNSGLQPKTAAAVESVASTSGQVLPPVMGASAFVMANLLGIRYIDVVTAGLVPAAILVVCIVVGVHYSSLRDSGEQTMEFDDFFDESMTRGEKLTESVRFGVPFAVLIYTLGVLQWTVMTSALYTVIAMVVLGILVPFLHQSVAVATGRESRFVSAESTVEESTSDSRRIRQWVAAAWRRVRAAFRFRPLAELKTQLANTVDGFRHGAIILAPIVVILAAINGVVDIFQATGVPAGVALMLIELSGGVLLFAVLLSILICIIMGMGMPTVASYLIVAILVAPTLVEELAVPQLAAHYTVFYAAILAGITPPVATAAIVAAGIAEADFWKTCAASIKMAAPLFVLPVVFVYHPEILGVVNGTEVELGIESAVSGLVTLLGGITIIYGLNYPFRFRRIAVPGIRLGLAALGIVVMVYPARFVQVGGIAVFAAVFVAEKVVWRDWQLPLIQSARR